jgi:hypothetical protein
VKVIDNQDFYVSDKLNEAYAAKIFREAVKLTWINCRTKDLLHIAIASLMMRKHDAKHILTIDEEDFSKVCVYVMYLDMMYLNMSKSF